MSLTHEDRHELVEARVRELHRAPRSFIESLSLANAEFNVGDSQANAETDRILTVAALEAARDQRRQTLTAISEATGARRDKLEEMLRTREADIAEMEHALR